MYPLPIVAANKPEKELKAFAKTKELKPGEAVVVTLKVNADDLTSYDEAASAWVVTPGNYKFLMGLPHATSKATLEAEVAAATQKTNNILKLQEPMSLFEEMRVRLSEKITNHTLKNILLYPLVWQDVVIFVPRINK